MILLLQVWANKCAMPGTWITMTIDNKNIWVQPVTMMYGVCWYIMYIIIYIYNMLFWNVHIKYVQMSCHVHSDWSFMTTKEFQPFPTVLVQKISGGGSAWASTRAGTSFKKALWWMMSSGVSVWYRCISNEITVGATKISWVSYLLYNWQHIIEGFWKVLHSYSDTLLWLA